MVTTQQKDSRYERYSRQIISLIIGSKGQRKLHDATVAIIGLGALGSVAAELLARAGVGTLVLVDRDCVEFSNLQRQFLYAEQDIGKPKAVACSERINAINSSIILKTHVTDLNYKNIFSLLKDVDVIIDGTDNLETRYLLNDFSKQQHISFIYGGALGSKGRMYVCSGKKQDPCFSCIFPDASAEGTCDTVGVLNTITSIIGTLQANECLKLLLGLDYEKHLIYVDVLTSNFQKFSVKRSSNCPTCNGLYDYLHGKKLQKHIKFCSSGQFELLGKKQSLPLLKKRWEKLDKVIAFPGCLHFKQLTIFADGRCLIKAKDIAEAKSLYARYVGV